MNNKQSRNYLKTEYLQYYHRKYATCFALLNFMHGYPFWYLVTSYFVTQVHRNQGIRDIYFAVQSFQVLVAYFMC